MSGFQEILLVSAIVLAVIFLPRMMRPKKIEAPRPPVLRRVAKGISGQLRLAILASIIWPVLAAAYFKPWNNAWIPFFYGGVLPVVLLWGVYWVLRGYGRKGRF